MPLGKQSEVSRKLSQPKKPKAVEPEKKTKPKSALNQQGWIGQNATSLTPRTSIADTAPAITPRTAPGMAGSAPVSPGLGTGGANITGTTVPGVNLEPYDNYDDTVGGGNPNGTAYTDLALNSGLLYDHPDVLAADYLASIGITNPEVIDMLTKQADLGYALQFILQGGDSQIASNADITGFVQDFIANLMTPGGGNGVDLNAMMGEILNADPNSPLGMYMAQNGPDAVNNLIMSASMATTNPYYQNAMKGATQTQARDYYGDVARGNPPDSYYQSLGGGPLAGYFPGGR